MARVRKSTPPPVRVVFTIEEVVKALAEKYSVRFTSQGITDGRITFDLEVSSSTNRRKT